MLLEAGVDPSARTKNKSTFLHLAGWSGLLDVVGRLLDCGDEMTDGQAAAAFDGKSFLEARTEDGDSVMHQGGVVSIMDSIASPMLSVLIRHSDQPKNVES